MSRSTIGIDDSYAFELLLDPAPWIWESGKMVVVVTEEPKSLFSQTLLPLILSATNLNVWNICTMIGRYRSYHHFA